MLISVSASAGIKVTASLDSASIMMGRVDTLRLIVDREAAVQGVFPLLHKLSPESVAGLCGDSIEMHGPLVDTLNKDGRRITERYRVPLQCFDSGYYKLPEFVYLTASDSVASNSVTLTVVPVKVGENEAISDFKDISEPSDKSFWDFLPDWLYELWWLWLICVIGIGGGLYAAAKYKKTGKFISLPEKPQPMPWTVALERLEALKAKGLWESGMEKDYFTKLTDILRDYLFSRFGINAMEMTSRQIMQKLTDQADVKDKRAYVRKILDMADFVKFAKVRPLPADNVEAYDNAVAFVNETIPAPVSEDAASPKNDVQAPPPVPVGKKNVGKGGDR